MRELYKILEKTFEFQTQVLRLQRASGMRWLTHRLRAMAKLVFINKYDTFAFDLEKDFPDTTKQTDKATVQRKFNLINVKLRECFFTVLYSLFT